MRPGRWWFLVTAVSLMVAISWSLAAAQEAPRIDKETLKSWLGNPEVMIIDVRQPGDWQASDKKIQGAVWEDPHAVSAWAATLPKNKKIVLYCA
jgi:rhodanese-related sulfurtransferase